MSADFINGSFEFLAGIMILNHCRVLWKEKSRKGVSKFSTLFFTLWGFWNIFYYPHLNQWWSFSGGIFVVAINAFYVGLMVHFDRVK